jgi:hypothetical protein
MERLGMVGRGVYPPCFRIKEKKGLTGGIVVSRGNKRLRGFLVADVGVLRSEMAQEQRPPSITAHNSMLFTECQLLFVKYYFRNWYEESRVILANCEKTSRLSPVFSGFPTGINLQAEDPDSGELVEGARSSSTQVSAPHAYSHEDRESVGHH